MRLFILLLFIYSISFGNNASYLEVQINYISENNNVIVGDTEDKNERLEILVSVLDSSGNLATKDINGDPLHRIEIKADSGVEPITPQHRLSANRALDEEKNIGRYLLDYSDITISSLQEDKITIKGGGKTLNKTVLLSSTNAKGLIVRAAPYTTFDTDKYINENFKDIKMDDEPTGYDLSEPSSRSPGGLAGTYIPITIYASTNTPTDAPVTNSNNGKFTIAPNLENRNIVLKVLADYNLTGDANVVLSTHKLQMTRGVAKKDIKINHALPSKTDNVGEFESSLSGGLPIAFIAYVEGNITIANKSGLDLEDDSKFTIKGDNNATDTVKIRSNDPSDIKVGKFNKNASKIEDLWKDTQLSLHVVNGFSDSKNSKFEESNRLDPKGSLEDKITITVIDSLDNPAYIDGTLPENAILKFNDEMSNNHFTYDKASSELQIDADNSSTWATYQISDGNGITTRSQTLSIDFRKGILASSEVKRITISHIPLIQNKTSGSAYILDYIKTDTGTSLPIDSATSGAISQKDLKFRLKASNTAGESTNDNGWIELKVRDPRDNDFLSDSDFRAKFEISCAGCNSTFSTSGVVKFKATSNPTISIKKKDDETISYATLAFQNDGDTYDGSLAKNKSAYIEFMAYEGIRVAAYVDVSILDFERRDRVSELYPGKKMEFKFSGDAVSNGDEVSIAFTTTSNGGKVGLINEIFSDNLTNEIITTMPSSKKIYIRLYKTNDPGIQYSINSIKINNAAVSYKTVEDNRDTDSIYELPKDTNITLIRSEDDGADYIEINASDATSGKDDRDGSDKRDLAPLSALVATSPSKEKIIYFTGKVRTNTYYHLFDRNDDLVVKDAYDNDIDLAHYDLRNFNLRGSDGVEVDMGRGTDSWIKFKDNTASTTQIVTVYFIDKPEVSFDIKFSNIEYSAPQNSNFNINMDIGSSNYTIVNSEFVIKVKPDGGKDQEETKLKFSHSDTTASVRVVLSALNSPRPGNEFDTLLGSDNAINETISKNGSYYIISANKPGTLTITADATIKARDSTTKQEEKLAGLLSINVVAADGTRPTLNPITDITVSGSTITVKVTDVNLNVSQTRVKLYTVNDVFIKNAIYSNGLFIFNNLPNGIYRIDIQAVDFSNNDYKTSIVKSVTSSTVTGPVIKPPTDSNSTKNPTTKPTPPTTKPTPPVVIVDKVPLQNALIAHRDYTITGMLFPYDFKKASHLNFAYYDYSTNKTYQFQGETPISSNLFGFKEVVLPNVTVKDTYSFYMVQLDGASGTPDVKGALGWVIFRKTTLTKVSKLSGATAEGTFQYQELDLKGVLVNNRTVRFERKSSNK